MYLLRSAALRSISSQPSSFIAKQRTFVTFTSTSLRSTSQWSSSIHQRRWASGEASPTDAQTSGETVTTEPSEAEQKDIEEKSVTSPDGAADASSSSQASNITETVKEKVQQVAQRATQAASSAAEFAPAPFRDNARSAAYSMGNAASTGGQPPQETKIVYVGNLFFEVTAEQLEREFAQYGDVVNSKIATDPKGLSKGFGFIEYDNLDSAAAAIKGLDQTVLQGRRMAVQYHVKREPRSPRASPMSANSPSKCLFIGNMSFQMSDKDLNDLFREVRNVLDVRVAIDRRSGQPRGFAHADFVDVASATKAKAALESKVIYGRTLRVDYSSSNSTRPQRGEE